MEYVYVVIMVLKNEHITVEVYDNEETAKGRAEILQANYYKRPIRFSLKDGFVTLDKQLAKHPYTCEITGLEVDRPCSECVIYKSLDSNCEFRPTEPGV